MTQVEIIKFLVDGTLLAAVGYLAITFGRSQLSGGQAARELRAVEESVRRLIRDADEASRELNDQLLRREQALKRTLSDIDVAEKKARELFSNVETKDSELRARIEVARELTRAPLQSSVVVPHVAAHPAAPSSTASAQPVSPAPQVELQNLARKHWTEVDDEDDDFGIKVDQEVKPAARSAGLAASIERQQVSPEIKIPVGATLQDIIKAAHRMIQEGAELQTVAARTRLPLEQVHLLARAFKTRENQSQRSAQSAHTMSTSKMAPTDSRLGVLGSIKREVHQV